MTLNALLLLPKFLEDFVSNDVVHLSRETPETSVSGTVSKHAMKHSEFRNRNPGLFFYFCIFNMHIGDYSFKCFIHHFHASVCGACHMARAASIDSCSTRTSSLFP